MSGGASRHAGNADAQWRAVTLQPDMCRVGKDVVGFSSFATLDHKVSYSPDVYGDGLQIYRVGDLFKQIQADAGSHIVSGTSGGSGHVLILSGHPTVKVNGKPVAQHGSACLINCNAAGIGGARGELTTVVKPAPRSMSERMADESGKVLKDKWQSAKDSARTVWDALPFTSDEATTQAARSRIAEGVVGAFEGLAKLSGPPPEAIQGAYLSGNAESIALIEQMQAEQQQAAQAVAQSIGQSWREASARSGTAGAVAMVATSIGTEVVGTKGMGALGKVSLRIAEIAKAAKTPLEAAQMLDKEVKAARAAGKSAEEIKLLEEARAKHLAEARNAQNARKAAAAEPGAEGPGKEPGVHIRATRVPCFHPYNKKKFKALSPEGKKAYLAEMSEQLKRQQNAINSMSAVEYKAARDAFENTKALTAGGSGRNPLADAAQANYRAKFSDAVEDSIGKSLKNSGIGAAQAEAEAARRTKELMSKLAALHEPDNVAGGWAHPEPKAMGRADVNSSIGSSWNQDGRVTAMDRSAHDSIRSGQGDAKMNVTLEVCRGKGLR